MDYWKSVDLNVHVGWADFKDAVLPLYPQRIVFSKSEKLGTKCIYDHDFSFDENTMLIMGSEKHGVPPEVAESLLTLDNVHYVYIPMTDKIRSYNLANAASMVTLTLTLTLTLSMLMLMLSLAIFPYLSPLHIYISICLIYIVYTFFTIQYICFYRPLQSASLTFHKGTLRI